MSVSLSADLVINGISLCFLGGATNNRKVFSFRRRAQMGSFMSYLRMRGEKPFGL